MANIPYHGIIIHEDIECNLNLVMSKHLSTAVKVEFHLVGEGEGDFLHVKWFNGEGQVCENYFNDFENRWLRSQFMTALTALFHFPFEVINHDMDDVGGGGADGDDDGGDDDTDDDTIDFSDGAMNLDDIDTDDADTDEAE
ncbi:hypothetical protein SEMRO_159_G071970.1 [Seminavis robusta]|uniref:Uncharacterized protein n=1 Tax=Seminavis robusta TaxID=568900 RepID=A0A9N8DIE7_9STRA|nr:hypothetical protein SEMRO_159_G071970.1 [Seminavis robusta]|eukprot:Sro159_g071970.1 n/a (141) ;mRNA; r:90887-91309